MAGDDTVDEHRGARVYGKGCHRDPVRSTHSYTAYRWGHKWVVLAILVKFPFATRLWALPVLAALYRNPEGGPKAKAPAKARTAALGRRESKIYEDMINNGRVSFARAPELDGMLEGGVPIIVDGHVVGAVGVSGVKSAEDVQIAKAGIAALGL